LRSVPNICCGDLGNFRPYGAFQSSFAVSPLLELQQQRETVRFVLPSALHKGTSTTDTDGDMPPGWLRSQSLHTPRKPSRPVTATRFYERQQTAADPLLWGPVIQHSMVNSATPDAPWKSPAMCARRIIQTVFARSKFIARWTVNTFIWGPVRFLVVVVIRKTDSFQPSDSSSKVSNSTTRPSQAASVSLSLMHYCLQEDLFPLLGFDQEHDLPEFGIFWEDPASAPTSLVTQVSIFCSLRCMLTIAVPLPLTASKSRLPSMLCSTACKVGMLSCSAAEFSDLLQVPYDKEAVPLQLLPSSPAVPLLGHVSAIDSHKQNDSPSSPRSTLKAETSSFPESSPHAIPPLPIQVRIPHTHNALVHFHA